jgi:hypothetical protein
MTILCNVLQFLIHLLFKSWSKKYPKIRLPKNRWKLRGTYFCGLFYKAASTSYYNTFSLRINQTFLNEILSEKWVISTQQNTIFSFRYLNRTYHKWYCYCNFNFIYFKGLRITTIGETCSQMSRYNIIKISCVDGNYLTTTQHKLYFLQAPPVPFPMNL